MPAWTGGVAATTTLGALLRVAGSAAAAMAAVFPAVFLTTMVSLWISQGEAVQVGAVGPMMLGRAAWGCSPYSPA